MGTANARKELQEANAAERLRELQSLLNLGTYSRENELKLLRKYRQDVEKYFELQSLHLERMEGARLASFHESPEVRGWRTSSHSCMLVISAYNDESLYSSRECWLSPVALDVVASFEGVENPDPLAFYILMYKDSDSLPRVLSCIALQLLTLKPKGLQDQGQYAELCAELEEYREQVPSGITDSPRTGIAEETNANSHIQKVLLRILNLFDGTKTVWIVVDRADRCKGHRMKLLKAFASLVKEAKVKVRVLVVVNGYDWKVDDEIDELRQREDKSVVLKIGRQGAIGF